MELANILKQVEGFTPPDVTVKIEKVWEYHHGQGNEGPWSFQDIQVAGTTGRLKLKGLPEFPKDREGLSVTIRANQSKQHGLTGMKVAHEEYKGKVYDKLIITPSAKWEWANPSAAPAQPPSTQSNGNGHKELTYDSSPNSGVEPYMAHLFGCAALAGQVAGLMKVSDDQALQACFATICIDTKNRGILLPKPNGDSAPAPATGEPEPEANDGAPWDNDPTDDY